MGETEVLSLISWQEMCSGCVKSGMKRAVLAQK